MVDLNVSPMPALSEEACRRLKIADWARSWAAQLDAQILSDMEARGELQRVRPVAYERGGKRIPFGPIPGLLKAR
jgi:hypothetical protein